MQAFLDELSEVADDAALLDFCRQKILHGTPHVFQNCEDDYYSFRKRIAQEFGISFHEVFVVGSAKLGFSTRKRKEFDLDSDIDVAIVSDKLFEEIMLQISDYQMQLRGNRRSVTQKELSAYHSFLEYGAIGWMRPDKLPTSFKVNELKARWFDFFSEISNGRSEVGNYKVSAGVFKQYSYLERYILSDMQALKSGIDIGVTHDNATT